MYLCIYKYTVVFYPYELIEGGKALNLRGSSANDI